MDGGLWGIIAVVPPLLSVEQSGGGVRVFWPRPATGFVLEETLSLADPPVNSWSQVAFPYQTNATHVSITMPRPAGQRFYRLRHP